MFYGPCVATGTTSTSVTTYDTRTARQSNLCLFDTGGNLLDALRSAYRGAQAFASAAGGFAGRVLNFVWAKTLTIWHAIETAIDRLAKVAVEAAQNFVCLIQAEKCTDRIISNADTLFRTISTSSLHSLNSEVDSLFAITLAHLATDCRSTNPHLPGQTTCYGAAHGRGGTTYGDYYVSTAKNVDYWLHKAIPRRNVLLHEFHHSYQWAAVSNLKMDQLVVYPSLYFRKMNPCANKFERDAGWSNGGYDQCLTRNS
jgi:hypothetical protein